MRIPLPTAAVCTAIALLAAGCGGGSNDSGTSAGSTTQTLTAIASSNISRDQFIAAADAICQQGDQATSAEIKKQVGAGHLSGSQLLEVGKIAAKGINDEIQKIRALGAPSGDEAALNSILDAAQSGAYQIDSNPQQLQVKGEEPNADLAKADREATAYGLKVCGGG